MVGDGDVFVAALMGGFGHFLKRRASVGFGGVHVEVATDVGEFHQVGQAPLGGGFDLAGVFAELGRDPGKAQLFVDLFFGRAGYAFVIVHVGNDARERVFAESESHFQGALAEGDVVVLAAGEVLESGAVAFGGEGAEVHLQSLVTVFDAGFVGTFA